MATGSIPAGSPKWSHDREKALQISILTAFCAEAWGNGRAAKRKRLTIETCERSQTAQKRPGTARRAGQALARPNPRPQRHGGDASGCGDASARSGKRLRFD